MADKQQIWRWKDGERPGPQFARAGEQWQFRLPMECQAIPPKCYWNSPLLSKAKYSVSDDTLTLTADIPVNLKGVYKIHYTIETEPLTEGFFLVKIITGLTVNSEEPPRPPNHVPPVVPAPPPETSPKAPRIDFEPIDTAGPLPSGNYFIQIFRKNVPIPQLKTLIRREKSVLIGQFSKSEQVFPDIDLNPHFENQTAAKLCSRKQAKIYWQENFIVISNLGKSDLMLSNGMSIEKEESHFWQIGEKIDIPGGLTMELIKE